MKLNSQKGFSLVEIGIALLISGIFMVCCIVLLSASNENYRRIEQRSLALSYAIKPIEAVNLNAVGIDLDDIKKQASVQNNMEVIVEIEDVVSKDGNKKLQIITANVLYPVKSNLPDDERATLTLQTLSSNY